MLFLIAALERGAVPTLTLKVWASNAKKASSSIAEEIVAKNYSARKVEYLVKSKKNINVNKKDNYDANILKAQERIEKVLGLKVNISNKKNNSGKISIEYQDLEQFELISDLLTKR